MSNQRFIEISSAYRNRTRYPKPSQFEVPFSPPPLNRQTEQIKAVYNDNLQIITRNTSVIDPVLKGIIEYMWKGTSFSTKSGILHYNNVAPNYALLENYTPTVYDGSFNYVCLFIRDALNTIVAIVKTTNIHTPIQGYLQVNFNPSLSLPSAEYTYTAYPEFATVSSATTTTSTISVSTLSSVYQTISDYYIGYRLTIYDPIESSSIIIGYNPSTRTFTLQTPLSAVPTVGSYITVTDPSTNAVVTLPGIDACGKAVLDYTQSYNGCYIVNETRSSGVNIASRKIGSYNYVIRSVTLETPFATWDVSDTYSIRKTLPNEFITTTIVQALNGNITQQLNGFTINVSGLDPNFSYKGFQTTINGAPNTIVSATINNTRLKFKNSFTLTFPFQTFTLIPTFTKL